MLQADDLLQRFAISDRISMEPLASKHTLELLETVNANRERLTVYLPWPEFVTNRREARHYISQRADSNAVDAYWFAIYFDDRFSGVIGSKGVDPETHVTEIGYWLADHGRGNKLIDQALSVLILHLKKRGNAKSVQFHCLEENIASIKIAERTGAKLKHYLDHEFDMLDRSQRLGVYELPLR